MAKKINESESTVSNFDSVLKIGGLIVSVFVTGFTLGQVFFIKGINLISDKKYLDSGDLDKCISNCAMEKNQIRKDILDSLSTKITIINTRSGQDRIISIDSMFGNIPYILPKNIPARPDIQRIAQEESDIWVLHWHAYGQDDQSERKMTELISKIHTHNPKAEMIVFSQSFLNSANVKKFKSFFGDPKIVSKITPITIHYTPSEQELLMLLSNTLEKIKLRQPQR